MDICTACGKAFEIGDWPFACNGSGNHSTKSFYRQDAQVHASEKVVVYENTRTGEQRVPGRGDRPIHPKLAAAGYERKVLDTVGQVKQLERRNGLIHEVGNYSDSR